MANLDQTTDKNKFFNEKGEYNRREWNNTTNQDIKGRFINREVLCNCGVIVDELQKAHHLDSELGFDIFEYIEPYYTASNGEEYNYTEAQEKIEELEEEMQELDSNIIYLEDEGQDTTEQEKEMQELEELKEELENADFDEYPEIFEYWFVTNWFAEKLKEKGQVIIDTYDLPIWGRQTTGQAILLDSIISQICEDLEILQGQKSDWSKQ